MIMTNEDDIRLVMPRDTSYPNDLIRTILKKVRIIPEKVLHYRHKLGFVLPPPMQRHVTRDKVVHYISEPR
jgi:hypothetical protein